MEAHIVRPNLTDEQRAVHLQIIAHATYQQLETTARMLGNDPDAVMEILETVTGIHLIMREADAATIEEALRRFADNTMRFMTAVYRTSSEVMQQHAHDNGRSN
jgi:hypothetical protein